MLRTLTATALILFAAAAYAGDAPDAAKSAAPTPPAAATEAAAKAADAAKPADKTGNGKADSAKADKKADDASARKQAGMPETPPAAPAKEFVYIPKPTDIMYGEADAPVTMVEYASLSCPHCEHFYSHTLPGLMVKYINKGKVRLIFRSFPLNEPALMAAEMVQCAPPDKRPAYVKVLFTSQMKWAYDTTFRDALKNIAVLGGMDPLKFESCMEDKAIERIVLDVAKEAQDDYKLTSTPTIYINGKEEKYSHDALGISSMIDEALSKPESKTESKTKK